MFAITIAWLLSSSIKAALLLATAWLVATVLRRGPAAARHQIWTFGVTAAVLLPLLSWALPALPVSSEIPIIAGASSLDASPLFVTGGVTAETAPAWPAWLAILWAAGTLLVSVRFLRGHLSARQLWRAARSAHADSHAALRDAATALAITQTIELRSSGAIGSPMTIGVLRPHVLLPAAADAWSRERLRAVLVHELGHVRRHDTLLQLVAQIACAVYWWNPLAWIAAARMRLEREHACDDLVLRAGIAPSSYAADLLAVARSISSRTTIDAVCMADRSSTETRLRRILDATAPRRPLRTRFRVAAGGLTLAITVILACTSAAPTTRDAAPKRQASSGTLSLGALSIRGVERKVGPMDDLALVEREVKRLLPTLEQCYRRRLVARPELAGTVVIHWYITTAGTVGEQCITEDTVGDEAIVACVNEVVASGQFPARGTPVDVSFPFVFGAQR